MRIEIEKILESKSDIIPEEYPIGISQKYIKEISKTIETMFHNEKRKLLFNFAIDYTFSYGDSHDIKMIKKDVDRYLKENKG